jgi:hypothetical protein
MECFPSDGSFAGLLLGPFVKLRLKKFTGAGSVLTDQHPMITPCVLTTICDPLLHCNQLRDGVIRDADISSILR